MRLCGGDQIVPRARHIERKGSEGSWVTVVRFDPIEIELPPVTHPNAGPVEADISETSEVFAEELGGVVRLRPGQISTKRNVGLAKAVDEGAVGAGVDGDCCAHAIGVFYSEAIFAAKRDVQRDCGSIDQLFGGHEFVVSFFVRPSPHFPCVVAVEECGQSDCMPTGTQ